MSYDYYLGFQYFFTAAFCAVLLYYTAFSYLRISYKHNCDHFLFVSIFFSAVSATADTIFGFREYGNITYSAFYSYTLTVIYSLSLMASGLLWVAYSEQKQKTRFGNNPGALFLVSVPTLLCALCIITTPIHHLVFYFEDGKYQKGPLFVLITLIPMGLIMWSGIGALVRSFHKEFYTQRDTLRMLFCYCFTMVFVAVLQVLLPPVMPYCSIGLTLLFIVTLTRFMKRQIKTDSLSGINNRYALEQYLFDSIELGERFGVGFLDLDKFKKINDTYGHKIGDEAIRLCAKAIIGSVPRPFFIARFGGDEFVVIGSDESVFVALEEKINARLNILAKEKALPFEMGISVGYVMSDGEKITVPELLAKADAKLYERKSEKKVARV